MFRQDTRPKAQAVTDEMVRAAVTRFLKNVNATAQGEIEKAIKAALVSGRLKGHETFTMSVALSSEKVGIAVTLYNTVEL